MQVRLWARGGAKQLGLGLQQGVCGTAAGVWVRGLTPDSPAGKCEAICEGDTLISVGGSCVLNTTRLEAERLLASASGYVTFRPNFHRFDRFELDLRGHIYVQGAAFSCLRLKWADMVLI